MDYTALFEGKALVKETGENGDLIIVGLAANFEGEDRQGENFMDGAFTPAINSFLAGSAALCYHHNSDFVLGKVLSLEEIAGKGLKMIARVDGAIRNDPRLAAIYAQIRKGTINGLSVGGFFRRKMTPLGPRIHEMDFSEISVTAVPVMANGTSFTVDQGKALEAEFYAVAARELQKADLRLSVAELRLLSR
jgi:HK97 family phage prohead protease